MRTLPVRSLFAAALFSLTGPFSPSATSGPLEADFAELRQACNRVRSLGRALEASRRPISPDIGQYEMDYKEAQDQVSVLRKATLARLSEELDRGETGLARSLAELLGPVPASDPARECLDGLAQAAANRVRMAATLRRSLDTREAGALREALLAAPPVEKPRVRPQAEDEDRDVPPIQIAFLWHMHQPIYFPGEDVRSTHERNVYSYSLYDVFHSRLGAYTSWPYDAVSQAQDLAHAGAQVSFSGSLMENLEVLEGVDGRYQGWQNLYSQGRRMETALGNPRLDLVAFGYHHPMMPLVSYQDIREQVSTHKQKLLQTFGADVPYSRGMFPPENAFAEWMIPALVDEGIEWILVDNIHFTRASKGYPWVKGEGLVPPNPAEQVNPDPGDWTQLSGLWAPSRISPWANRPHYVVHRDPETGEVARTPEGKVAKILAIPADRYMGNEDGRGGFGALNYEAVMSQLEGANSDPDHPLLIVLHHDGDNYGGGSYGYYHDNFARFVAWLRANPSRFEMTTIQDYVDRFPPAEDDVIHVEPGSWAGADNGDPEFSKWNGDPAAEDGYSPDRNSWGVMVAGRNVVEQARASGAPAEALARAERAMAVSRTSCYEYWDGTEMWDSHPTRAVNQAVEAVSPWLSEEAPDTVAPGIYLPQRQPYNPGGMEWGAEPESADFTVWTYVYDHFGLEEVALRYRVHPGVTTPSPSTLGAAGGEWSELAMEARAIPSRTNPEPLIKADEYSVVVTGLEDALVDYMVVARDHHGNEARSPLQHVYVGKGVPAGAAFEPAEPTAADAITVYANAPGTLHWAVNDWTQPAEIYWPEGSTPWHDGKAVRTPLTRPEGAERWQATVGPFQDGEHPVDELDFVLHLEDGSWGQDVRVEVRP